MWGGDEIDCTQLKMSKNLINLTFGGSFGFYNQIPDGFYITKINNRINKIVESPRGC